MSRITLRVFGTLPPLQGDGVEPQIYYVDGDGVLRGSVTWSVLGENVAEIETSDATAAFLRASVDFEEII